MAAVRLGRRLAHLRHEAVRPQHQAAAAFTRPRVQIKRAVGEERQPVGHGETGPVHFLVPHEQRHDLVRAVQGRPQRMVVQARIGGNRTTETFMGRLRGRAAAG